MDPDPLQVRKFGRFRLDVSRKVLWFGEDPVDLPLKEIELLCVLTEKSGELLTKEELLNRVWADSFVEESNLSRHIYLIRQTFKKLGEGEDWIHTIARRGYRFTGEVSIAQPNLPSVVIERHSLTRTLMEEVPVDDSANSFWATLALRGLTPQVRVTAVVVSVLVIATLIGGFVYYGNYRANAISGRNIKSIAILPFKTMGADGKNSDEGIGLADIVISRLSPVQAVTVRPTSAVMKFANSDEDATSIGKDLQVDAVLEGSIYRSGDKTRVTARLISVSDRRLIWSSQFERLKTEELRLHNEIALELANALSLNLSDAERREVTKRSTENADAYQLYLQGRSQWNKRNNEGLIESEHLFRKAIDSDPSFALAYVGLADSQMFMPTTSAEVHNALRKAIELDPNLGEAYASLGFLLTVHRWEWQRAEESFKKAIELNPGYPIAHHWYATLLSIEGRHEEAKVEMQRALDINPMSYNFLADLGQIYYFNHEYDKAKEYCEKALAIYPEFSFAHQYLSTIHLHTGNYEEAIKERLIGLQLLNLSPYQTPATEQGNVDALAKAREPFVRGGIKEFLKNDLTPPGRNLENENYGNALTYSLLEDDEKAIVSLEAALEKKEFSLAWVKAEPTFDRLKNNPKFKAVLKKMNLPQGA